MTAVGYERSFRETFGHVCLTSKTGHPNSDVRLSLDCVRFITNTRRFGERDVTLLQKLDEGDGITVSAWPPTSEQVAAFGALQVLDAILHVAAATLSAC